MWAVDCAISVRKGQDGKAKRGSVMGTIDSQVSGRPRGARIEALRSCKTSGRTFHLQNVKNVSFSAIIPRGEGGHVKEYTYSPSSNAASSPILAKVCTFVRQRLTRVAEASEVDARRRLGGGVALAPLLRSGASGRSLKSLKLRQVGVSPVVCFCQKTRNSNCSFALLSGLRWMRRMR